MITTIYSFEYCVNFLVDQLSDVGPANMTAQPNGIVNHPAWVIGHLTFSCQAIGGELGLEKWLPAEFAKQYGMGSVPVDDARAYPDKEVAINGLRDASTRIQNAVKQLTDEQLSAPLPDERYHKDLPSVGHALTQILVAHSAYHIGQVAMWRNAMGYPPMSRPFL